MGRTSGGARTLHQCSARPGTLANIWRQWLDSYRLLAGELPPRLAGTVAHSTSTAGLLVRVVVAFALTYVLGYERELRGSPAGDRTFS
jgi:hypothetical protein